MTRAGWLVASGFVVLTALVAALFLALRAAPPAAPRTRSPAAPITLAAARATAPAATPPRPAPRRPAPASPSAGDAEPAGPPPISPRLDGARVRQMVLDDLRNSGNATEDWNGDAETVFAAIGRPPVSFTDDGCFVAGCAATFTYPSVAAYEQAMAALPTVPAFSKWTGGKRHTAPDVRPDGTVLVAVVLYRPD